MRRIDFLISNDRHHVAAAHPVIESLQATSAVRCTVVSLCELRGLTTPTERLPVADEAVLQLLPGGIRRSSSAGVQKRSILSRFVRVSGRRLFWRLVLREKIRNWLDQRPDAVVVPNDSAFPFDLIALELRKRSIPFVLLQEGVRFELPSVASEGIYGGGGASWIAAWGQGSAEYFHRAGIPPERVSVTGAPRFDAVLQQREAFRKQGAELMQCAGITGRVLLFLSNPIDDQGFCTTAEKMDLISRFLHALAPLLERDLDLSIVFKLHSRESVEAFEQAAAESPHPERVSVLADAPLYPLIANSDAAIVLASTTGLEALLFDVPLGVLEIPGAGFVFDYVQRGAAMGISWNSSIADQVEKLMAEEAVVPDRIAAYVRYCLAAPGVSAEKAASLCLEAAGIASHSRCT